MSVSYSGAETTRTSRPAPVRQERAPLKQAIVDEVLRVVSRRLNYFGGVGATGPAGPLGPAGPADVLLRDDLASTTANKGASLVGIYDLNANFLSTTVEGALGELYQGNASTDAILRANLASTSAGQGASLIGINDSSSVFTATQVEGVLKELYLNNSSSAFIKTLLDDATATAARATLEIVEPSAFIETLMDDADAVNARATLAIAGKCAIPIPATALTPRSANGCAVLAQSNGASNQPDIPYLAFDGAAKEYAGFSMRMPKSWNESTVTFNFDWRRASGTGAANVVWGARAVAVSDADSGAATFGSDATVTDAASTTVVNFNLSAETSACTIGGSPAEGDLVFFEVFRDGASGSDTLDAVDAWLTGVTLFITLNETNDA